MYCREDLRKLKRITVLWDYVREVTEMNRGLLLGETATPCFKDLRPLAAHDEKAAYRPC